MPPKPSKNGKPADPRLAATVRTINDLKRSKPSWEELVKLCSKYHNALEVVTETARAFTAGMRAAASHAGKNSSLDVQRELYAIADIHDRLETHRTNVRQSLSEGFMIPIKRYIDAEMSTLQAWEKNYKAHFKYLNNEMTKAEEASKSAGKKNAAALQQAILDLTSRVKEIETARQSKLRELFLVEREKYCGLLLRYVEVVKSELKLHEDGFHSLGNGVSGWCDLASSKDSLPADSESLITAKERTFVGLKTEGGSPAPVPSHGGGYGGHAAPASYGGGEEYGNEQWDEEEVWDEELYDDNSGYNNQQQHQPQQSYGGGYHNAGIPAPPAPPPMGPKPGQPAQQQTWKVRALYDNVADDAQELSFRAGDIIEVTKQVNDEWWAGLCNGQHGIFPSNYCEQL
ncbi:hypothetical protein CAOG_00314 [Capsaspora owczarzaki ATCC 30864]|uniref:SH3 domain-containing protein n=1 Tax=Capsaspora owczarzaki (strain ATCC 30864) TaxID=595528 RepID=A0A0D2X0A5_CAPO3|nr:hypothetical protein CAOG_00314 [Capsaspora owczarzaki ATCC 30864]KJE88719.1 hypothetical protein CAOG_000314 [Capsaspora owczarzaki ATCC 30864]|eukprot:XP_004365185.1 hypothetical protein CAOG_00314 [Capsaspora owczarzaki ATCC 30864]